MKRNFKLVLSVLTVLFIVGLAGMAFAQPAPDAQQVQAAKTAKELAGTNQAGWVALAAGLGLGLAALGGALGQGRAAAAALDGIARNPGAADKIRGPMSLALALIESLVIYSLVISIVLAFTKVHV